jgi:CheY-like chemotaxis protein
MISGRPAKILLIDSNVYFSKRLGDALKKEGFIVQSSTQPAFALTTLEYDAPTAVVCATNMREMGALEIAKIIHSDPKNEKLPIIALGDGSQRALMEAFQAGCEDYIDRQRPPAVIAAHIRQIIISKAEGFQPTQMLNQADTSLSGSLTHHDLAGVLQMLGHAHQTGALHINAGSTDAIIFFDAGNITHAECGNLFGDEAVIHIVKSCIEGGQGVYKFVYGATSPQHTVLRNATDLMLDAMREYDESSRGSDAPNALDSLGSLASSDLQVNDNTDSEPSLLHSFEPASQSEFVKSTSDDSVAIDKTSIEEDSTATRARQDFSVEADSASALTTFVNGSTDENSRINDIVQVSEAAASAVPQIDRSEQREEPALHSNSANADIIGTPSTENDSASSLKRSDILQSELATHTTTISERVLSDLRSHGDNPVDRALAELLSEQLAGNNAHPLPPSTDSVSDVSDEPQDDHVHHANNPDQEHP